MTTLGAERRLPPFFCDFILGQGSGGLSVRQRFVDSYIFSQIQIYNGYKLSTQQLNASRDEAVYDTQKNKVKVKKSFIT